MIQTRVLVGSILALAAVGVLVGDWYLAPWFPCLFACLMVSGVLASREMLRLFPAAYRPAQPLLVGGVLLCLAANWFPTIRAEFGSKPGSVWTLPLFAFVAVLFAFVAVLLVGLLAEMYRFQEPGQAIPRLGALLLAVAYLGVLPCFFTQIRFLPTQHAGILLALTICVPKCNDVAAYFTGTFLGWHRMTPLLSPKKTWEGFVGGMLGSVLASVGLSLAGSSESEPVFRGGVVEAVAFGLFLGLAGVLGDLAESLLKRDCQIKDASKTIPGFGGLLDVVDSVLFAAPIAYLWFVWN